MKTVSIKTPECRFGIESITFHEENGEYYADLLFKDKQNCNSVAGLLLSYEREFQGEGQPLHFTRSSSAEKSALSLVYRGNLMEFRKLLLDDDNPILTGQGARTLENKDSEEEELEELLIASNANSGIQKTSSTSSNSSLTPTPTILATSKLISK